MRLMKKRLVKNILLSVFLPLGIGAAHSAEWKTFGGGEERWYHSHMFIIQYPPEFSFSPDSDIFPVRYIGERNRNKKRDSPIDCLILQNEKNTLRIIVPTRGPVIGGTEETMALIKTEWRLKNLVEEARKGCYVIHGGILE